MKTITMLKELESVNCLTTVQAEELAKLALSENNNLKMRDELEQQIFNINFAGGSTNTIYNIVSKYMRG